MKIRTLIVTIGVLAVLSLVVFFLRRPAPPRSEDERIDQPLVAGTTIEKMVTLQLADQGRTVALQRQSDGSWRVTSYHDLPADFSKLSGFINNLTEAKLQRLVTSNPDRIARLEFQDTKIELLDADGKELFAVTLGKHPESGSGRFVRFGSENRAYLANLSAWLDTEAKNWANSELVNIKSDDLAKIEIPLVEGGTVTVTRATKDEPWKAESAPEGRTLKTDKVTSVIGSLGNLRFSDSTEPGDAKATEAKAHLRTFKLTTFGGTTYTVALGRKPEEKKLKPPAADATSGPAALGSFSSLTEGDGKAKADEKKPLEPEFETIPAGPVFAYISSSDSTAPVNALMAKRAFQISDYIFTGLPQKADDLFEATTPAADAATDKPADDDQPTTQP